MKEAFDLIKFMKSKQNSCIGNDIIQVIKPAFLEIGFDQSKGMNCF